MALFKTINRLSNLLQNCEGLNSKLFNSVDSDENPNSKRVCEEKTGLENSLIKPVDNIISERAEFLRDILSIAPWLAYYWNDRQVSVPVEDIQDFMITKNNADLCSSRISHKTNLACVSEFIEAECGEPLASQHLVLDFTQVPGVDDYDEKKCSDFWGLIYSRPELKNLMVVQEVPRQCSQTQSSEIKYHIEQPTVVVDKDALNWLTDNNAVLRDAFATRERNYYGFNSKRACGDKGAGGNSDTDFMARHRRCLESLPSQKTQEARMLCEQMTAWDDAHPHSFQPPGPPIVLHHATFIRKLTF